MATDRFYIGPYEKDSGVITSRKPFVIPDQAFSELFNAYIFRGRVKKRYGSRWLADTQQQTRLRIKFAAQTGGTGNFAGTAPGNPVLAPADTWKIGQAFSVNNAIFTVYQANGAMFSTTAATGTFDTATGNVTITGADALSDVYFYPSLPVMGLLSEETISVNDEPVFGFDTQFAYQYTNGWERLANEDTLNASVWSGSNSQFFWGTNWVGVLPTDKVFFVTNFNQNEQLRKYYAGSWDFFYPAINATEFLNSARILVVFKNCLLALNTWEGDTLPGRNYQNRCRYSGFGSPLEANAWRQDLPGNGNFIDAATTESIITVEFIKDRLIVFFERSTWELAYTGNNVTPFTFQKINTELGAESTFSVVPFDKVVLGVGNVGVHACNGFQVDRIDNSIPDTIFQINNLNQGTERVYGIRDYKQEVVYWTYPTNDQPEDYPYPNRVLVYNYNTSTWGFNDNTITVFGFFQPTLGVTWDSNTVTWNSLITWSDGELQGKFRHVVAGNQQGWTYIIDPNAGENACDRQITNLTYAVNVVTLTSIDHNLRAGDYIYLNGITSSGNLNVLNDMIFQISRIVTKDTLQFNAEEPETGDDIELSGVYKGGGIFALVSNINILTKEYNFYAQEGYNCYLSKAEFLVTKTDQGSIQVDYFVSSNADSGNQASLANDSLMGTGTLDTFAYPTVPFEANAVRVWHPLYFNGSGEYVQLQFTMSDDQMRDTIIRKQIFELHAMLLWTQKTNSRLQ